MDQHNPKMLHLLIASIHHKKNSTEKLPVHKKLWSREQSMSTIFSTTPLRIDLKIALRKGCSCPSIFLLNPECARVILRHQNETHFPKPCASLMQCVIRMPAFHPHRKTSVLVTEKTESGTPTKFHFSVQKCTPKMNNQRHLKRKDLHSSLSPLSSNRCHSKPYQPRFDEGTVSAVTRKRCCHGQYIRNLTPFCAKANAHKMLIEIQNAHRLRKTPLKCAQGRSQSAEGVLKGQLFEKNPMSTPLSSTQISGPIEVLRLSPVPLRHGVNGHLTQAQLIPPPGH